MVVRDKKVQLLTLFLLDYAMKKCTFAFHNQVGLKGFMNTMITLINSKEVENAVRFLISGEEEDFGIGSIVGTKIQE